MFSVDTVINTLSFATLLSNISFVLFALVYFHAKFVKKSPFVWIVQYVVKNAALLSFVFAGIATIGSLFLSEIAKFTPCMLCWYQRIFMYPLAFLLGTAYFKKTRDIASYVLPLSVIGLLIALFHYYQQITHNPLSPCSAIGFSASCSDQFITHYGYITIPWMSLSAFAYITSLMVLLRKSD